LPKKGKEKTYAFSTVYFFLSINSIATPTIAIAAIIPPVAGNKYWSAKDVGACVGSGLAAGASATFMAVSE